MPNWCHNTLVAEAEDHRLLEQLAKDVRPEDQAQGPLCFSSLAPEPGNPDDPNYDWYMWRLENWGTKWEPSFGQPMVALGRSEADPEGCFQGCFENVGRFLWKFDTAWAPPLPWVETASERYPEITFTLRFGELGTESAGEIVFLAGETVSSRELEIEDVLEESEMWY